VRGIIKVLATADPTTAQGVWMILLQIARMDLSTCCVLSELSSDAVDGVDELALRYRIALGDPAGLTFADCMHGLIALDSVAP